MRKIYLGLFALVCCVSCDKDNKSETSTALAAPTAPFLSAANLAKPANVTPKEAIDFNDFLETESSLFQATSAPEQAQPVSDVDDTAESAEMGTCFENLFKGLTSKATDSSVVIAMAVDLSSCLNLNLPISDDFKVEFKGFVTSIYASLDCPGDSLTAFNGKSYMELNDQQLNTLCKKSGKLLVNGLSEGTIVWTSKTDGSFTQTIKVASSVAAADNQACTFNVSDGVYSYSNACQQIQVSDASVSMNNETTVQADYSAVTFNDATWKAASGESWYASGKVSAVVNDWTGTVTFNGSDLAPDYSFSNGSTTLTGKLAYEGALRAQTHSLRNAVLEHAARLRGQAFQMSRVTH